MPGFSRDEQIQLALLGLAHRRSLKKIQPQLEDSVDWRAVMALRLAVLVYRGRTDLALPALQAKAQGTRFRLTLDPEWLDSNPLTAAALREEALEWERIGRELRVPGLEELERAGEAAGALVNDD
jgi:exopolyphosphatase/guanosine-5'-triphosphate,3'-diphosphate pyrophosphatase